MRTRGGFRQHHSDEVFLTFTAATGIQRQHGEVKINFENSRFRKPNTIKIKMYLFLLILRILGRQSKLEDLQIHSSADL